MNTNYQNLAHKLLTPGTTITHRHQPEPRSIRLADSAAQVYTDFSLTRPFSVSAATPIDQVNGKMIACGVRLLFVTEGDAVLQGLVTYSDLFGDKPVRYIQAHGGTRNEILAQDIMTSLAQLEALHRPDVEKSRVGDIVETIKAAGRQHMLVSDVSENGGQTITGLFSLTHIEKLLGIKIELSARAQTFSELERALG
jgi:ferric-dicitrate binding protein FerR (iron transport regulator)